MGTSILKSPIALEMASDYPVSSPKRGVTIDQARKSMLDQGNDANDRDSMVIGGKHSKLRSFDNAYENFES